MIWLCKQHGSVCYGLKVNIKCMLTFIGENVTFSKLLKKGKEVYTLQPHPTLVAALL